MGMNMLNNLRYRVKEQKEYSSGSFRGGIEKKRRWEKDHKGFTLVELIVVIVILAILAAILIPGLLKWIDEAKKKKYELEARSIYLAVEASLAVGPTKGFKGVGGATLESAMTSSIRQDRVISDATTSNQSLEWLSYIKEMSGIDSIHWMRCYFWKGKLRALSIDYKSDGKCLNAWINEINYECGNDGGYYNECKQDDGMWHITPHPNPW